MESTGPRGADDWLTPGRFAGGLALLLFVTYPGLILGGSSLVLRDFGLFTYPVAHYFRECFWRGELPLWNPLNICGVPLLAQWNTQLLYPPALFYLLLPLPWSLNVFCVAHLFWGGLGMYFLARRWTGSTFAAALAGVAYAFSGLPQSCLMWLSNGAALAWMPWVLLTAERAWREGGRSLVPATLAGALQMLAGSPEFTLLTWLLVILLRAGESISFRGGLRIGWRGWARLATVAVLVAGVSAAQLLPFFDLLTHSQRATDYYHEIHWAMPWWGWANFLIPKLYCYQIRSGVTFQEGQLWVSSYYTGIGITALALFAAWRLRQARVWLLAGALLATLMLALGAGGFVYLWLQRLVPGIGFMRYPIKFAGLVPLLMCALAATGVAWWQTLGAEETRRARNAMLAVIAAMGAVALGALWLEWKQPLPYTGWSGAWQNALSRFALLCLTVGGLWSLKTPGPSRQRCLQAGVLLLVWFDLDTHLPPINPAAPATVFAAGMSTLPVTPRAGESRAMISPAANYALHYTILGDLSADYLGRRLSLHSDSNLIDGLAKVDGFFSLYPREVREVISPLYASTTDALPEGMINFLGVACLTAPGEVLKWEMRSNALPFVTAGQKPNFLAQRDATLNALYAPEFNPRQTVCLPEEARPLVNVTNQTSARVLACRYSPHRIEVEVDAPETSLVVISQTYYHRWRAYLENQPVPLLRANHGFQAVQVPSGRHRVTLVYEDYPFQIGAAISIFCLIVLLLTGTHRPRQSVRRV